MSKKKDRKKDAQTHFFSKSIQKYFLFDGQTAIQTN